MTSCHVRAAIAADAKGIAIVHVDSWKETYSGIVPATVGSCSRLEKNLASAHPILFGEPCLSTAERNIQCAYVL